MSAEGYKPSAAEQEQIDAMSPEHKEMGKNREGHIWVDENDIRQSIELPLRGIEGDLSSIDATLEAWANDTVDLSGKDRSPRVKEDIEKGRKIASEISQKLAELDGLFRTTSLPKN